MTSLRNHPVFRNTVEPMVALLGGVAFSDRQIPGFRVFLPRVDNGGYIRLTIPPDATPAEARRRLAEGYDQAQTADGPT